MESVFTVYDSSCKNSNQEISQSCILHQVTQARFFGPPLAWPEEVVLVGEDMQLAPVWGESCTLLGSGCSLLKSFNFQSPRSPTQFPTSHPSPPHPTETVVYPWGSWHLLLTDQWGECVQWNFPQKMASLLTSLFSKKYRPGKDLWLNKMWHKENNESSRQEGEMDRGHDEGRGGLILLTAFFWPHTVKRQTIFRENST